LKQDGCISAFSGATVQRDNLGPGSVHDGVLLLLAIHSIGHMGEFPAVYLSHSSIEALFAVRK